MQLGQQEQPELTRFSLDRIAILAQEVSKIWIQSGRVPDMDSINVMVTSIEADLPSWISGFRLRQAITAFRASNRGTPKVCDVIEWSEKIRDEDAQKAAQRPLMIASRNTHTCRYCAVVAHRLARYFASKTGRPQHTAGDVATDWEERMLSDPASAGEVKCFVWTLREMGCWPETGLGNPYEMTNEHFATITI